MHFKPGGASRKLCRLGCTLILVVPAGSSLASRAEVVVPPEIIRPANVDDLQAQQPEASLSLACRQAVERSLSIAPEVLALASWPLDDNPPAECAGEPGDLWLSGTVDRDIGQTQVSLADLLSGLEALPEPGRSWDALLPPGRLPGGPFGDNLLAVAEHTLDEMRGGFELADTSLKFSFGIERAVFINGQLVASTVLNLNNLAQGTAAVASQVQPGSLPASVALVQNGAGNGFSARIADNLTGTVIQNSLNNQAIQNVTTVNAVVNSGQMIRAMSLQSSIQQGIISSLRR